MLIMNQVWQFKLWHVQKQYISVYVRIYTDLQCAQKYIVKTQT